MGKKLFSIIGISLLFLLTGYITKNAINVDEFMTIAEKNNINMVDIKSGFEELGY